MAAFKDLLDRSILELPRIDLDSHRHLLGYNCNENVSTESGEVQIVETKTYIQSGKITKIEILKHINGQGKNAEQIIDNIMKQQKINVDTISGATYSSKAIQKAIENSLK